MTNQRRKRRKQRLFLPLCLLIIINIISTAAFAFSYSERFAPPTEMISLRNTLPAVQKLNLHIAKTASAANVPTLPAPDPDPSPESTATTPKPVDPANRELLARVIFAESGNQSLDGKIAVGEVVINRLASAYYPDTIEEILYQYDDRHGWQFVTAPILESVEPDPESYHAADQVLRGASVLPAPQNGKLVVFFSRAGENPNVATVIEDHVFCYAYNAEP